MKIAQNKVVSMQYQISEVNGEILETSEPGEEWCFLVGSNELPPGLERALEGHEVGDSISVTVPPADGYGERDEDLITTLPRSELDEDIDVEVGDELEAETDDGVEFFKVLAVDAETITVDSNHDLAGKTLKFDVTIQEVRDATPEELEHGHAHGAGCHEFETFDEEWDDDDDDEWDDDEEEKKA